VIGTKHGFQRFRGKLRFHRSLTYHERARRILIELWRLSDFWPAACPGRGATSPK
jgi:hypothetical protein